MQGETLALGRYRRFTNEQAKTERVLKGTFPNFSTVLREENTIKSDNRKKRVVSRGQGRGR